MVAVVLQRLRLHALQHTRSRLQHLIDWVVPKKTVAVMQRIRCRFVNYMLG